MNPNVLHQTMLTHVKQLHKIVESLIPNNLPVDAAEVDRLKAKIGELESRVQDQNVHLVHLREVRKELEDKQNKSSPGGDALAALAENRDLLEEQTRINEQLKMDLKETEKDLSLEKRTVKRQKEQLALIAVEVRALKGKLRDCKNRAHKVSRKKGKQV